MQYPTHRADDPEEGETETFPDGSSITTLPGGGVIVREGISTVQAPGLAEWRERGEEGTRENFH